MSNISILEFQYNISRTFSSKLSRKCSGLSQSFHPNVDEMKRVFDKFDANKDGKISKEEYREVLKALQKENVKKEVEKIFEVADKNKDEFIDFKEFMKVHKKSGVSTKDIRCAFREFDSDDSGKISAEEVRAVLSRLGERCSLEDCRRMVGGVDTDGDGFVGMEEFMNMMTRTMKPF
ncbi:hypothetical protein HHK36_009935 [Tetracentron sinense]|uniref:EF-hand domain-containing protein n=1 Tax=Tetracentron sinense TaxID=13715 RepID=A0A834ZGZ6_TETSI|nr:hypothetical protein HHK36_009935 [Tetracentron sinense]